ncbi:MAG TPA: squalene/phytoene synthase family protein, partial [Haliangium sp.]|nr:squalene/phytoene synthase family protein [Haliangium sp.]
MSAERPLALRPDAISLCRQTIAAHSRSFALASRVLPPRCRDEAAVVYTWCRRADDAVDLAPPGKQAGALVRLGAELDGVYDGEAQEDIALAAFQEVVQRHRIPREYPAELLAGMDMDARGQRYDDMHTLLLYCYRVASTVGLMMSHVMGVTHDGALRHAAHLGMAMQLTNICR